MAKVQKAIILAAGLGERLLPVTQSIPKPLVSVNGVRIIDTIIDALLLAGITDVYIVRGYLSEKFSVLLEKYPNIQFMENPYFKESNNISSVYVARDKLQNSYIIEGDLYIHNPNVIVATQSSSNYIGKKADKTDDWCFETKDDEITNISIGGEDCYHMYGVSYWDNSDGKRLKTHIERVFGIPSGKNLYWDEVALGLYKDDYTIKIRECMEGDIIEIDTVEELEQCRRLMTCRQIC